MFERFTDRARMVMALANQHAHRLNSGHIGSEHVLLGFVQEGSSVGAHVLLNLGVRLEDVKAEVEKLTVRGDEPAGPGKLPPAPPVKNVIAAAVNEARRLGHNYVGTEHLLLGLCLEEHGVAAQVLRNLDVTLERAREETLEILGSASPADPQQRLRSPDESAAPLRDHRSLLQEYPQFEDHALVQKCVSLIREFEELQSRYVSKNDIERAYAAREHVHGLLFVLTRLLHQLSQDPEFGQ